MVLRVWCMICVISLKLYIKVLFVDIDDWFSLNLKLN